MKTRESLANTRRFSPNLCDYKCIAKKSLNRSLKDLTKSGILPGKIPYTHIAKKKGKKNKRSLSLRKGK